MKPNLIFYCSKFLENDVPQSRFEELTWMHLLLKGNFKVGMGSRVSQSHPSHLKIGMATLSEQQLLLNFQEKNCTSCFAELYKRFAPKIMGTCMKYLKNAPAAEDAVMDIFEKMIKKLKVSTPENFQGWVYSVSRNHCIEILRKRKKTGHNAPLEEAAVIAQESSTYEVEEIDERSAIFEALSELPRGQKICVYLFYLRKKRYAEIVAMTGMELGTVKSHIQNGKRNLKRILMAWYGNYKIA